MNTITKKTARLKKIRDAVWNLKKSPLYAYRTKNHYYPVLGEGDHDADIMFVGEAPGKNEAEQGRPFCGAAGNILTELVESIGLKRQDVYITNIVKDRPPENRDPTEDEIALYAPFLDKQIEIIEPKIIATLGRFSMQYCISRYVLKPPIVSISMVHGQLFEAYAHYGLFHIIPLYHPAVCLYDGSKKKILFNDMKIIEKSLPIIDKRASFSGKETIRKV